MLTEWVAQWQQALGILHKRDIQLAATHLGSYVTATDGVTPIRLGDDCAAIPDGDGYLLLAAEGIWPTLVQEDPWFAGWCGVLVNVSDIYAMGGRPLAVVDALWSPDQPLSQSLWAGMRAAAQVFNVPIVGGHSNGHSPYPALAVAILGRAHHLLTSFDAQPGDALMVAVNLEGHLHGKYPFWDAATQGDPIRLRKQLDCLPALGTSGWCQAAKDISMGGLLGTTLMLLETSGCGAVLDLTQVPHPPTVPLPTWMVSFPSYGFLLSVPPIHVAAVKQHFTQVGITCGVVGTVTSEPTLILRQEDQAVTFWDFRHSALTGF